MKNKIRNLRSFAFLGVLLFTSSLVPAQVSTESTTTTEQTILTPVN